MAVAIVQESDKFHGRASLSSSIKKLPESVLLSSEKSHAAVPR